MREKDLHDLAFVLAFRKIVDAYHINFMDFCEVISLSKRLQDHLKKEDT